MGGFVTKTLFIAGGVFLLFFLAACEDATVKTTVPFNGTRVENITTSACECSAGETCENGKCVCKGKTCQGRCIPVNACCTSAECGDGECVSGKCVSTICPLGEELYQGECICAQGMVRCKEQNKCIDQKSCCHSGQCDRTERCVPTVWKASVCVEAEGRKICRALADNNRTEQITTLDLRLKPIAWSNNGNITLTVNNSTFQLAKNQKRPFDSLTIYQEGIEVIGGFCKEDED